MQNLAATPEQAALRAAKLLIVALMIGTLGAHQVVNRTFVKRDRAARLLAIANLMFQHPAGLTVPEIAERVGMHVRTIYRDLRAMQDELPVRVWQQDRRWGAERTSILPPLKLTLGEAVALFLSARLMQRHADAAPTSFLHSTSSPASCQTRSLGTSMPRSPA